MASRPALNRALDDTGRRRRAKRARTPRHRDAPIGSSGRRRRAPSRVCTSDWANLTVGPAAQIADLLLSHSLTDYVRFRAVCSAWHVCADDPRAHGGALDSGDRRFLPRRWIMLPHPFHSMSRRPFLDFFTGESIHVRLPDLYGRHHVLGSTSEGLLLLCRKDTLAVQLLNPLTGQRADLPRVTTLLKVKASPPRSRLNDFRVGGAGLAGDSTVALHHYGGDSGSANAIAVARPRDKCWTRLHVSGGVKSAMSFAGRFYCVTSGNILVVETAANRQPPRLAVAVDFGPGNGFAYRGELQLVDNGGELILVHLVCYSYVTFFSGKYTAYRVRLDTRSIEPMHGLSGRALFMGASRSLSMRARVSRSLSADTVYKCSNYDKVSGRAKSVVAIDTLGRCSRIKFHEDDAAHYLSSYVCA